MIVPVDNSAVFVTARVDDRLVGIARGVTDGVRGYMSECKRDPVYQGPAPVTRTGGRIEHATDCIAAEMARPVLHTFRQQGLHRVGAPAWERAARGTPSVSKWMGWGVSRAS